MSGVLLLSNTVIRPAGGTSLDARDMIPGEFLSVKETALAVGSATAAGEAVEKQLKLELLADLPTCAGGASVLLRRIIG